MRNCSAWFVLVNADLWSEVHFDRSNVPVKVWVGCSVGCCVL